MHDLPNQALVNYVFPNDAHVHWELMIVIYPFVTGLIAGAFFVSALYHVFKVQAFRPIASFALVVSFCFGLFAGMPLQLHLGHPERAFNIFFTPAFSSPMSMFGYIYSSYMCLLTIELWLVYRGHFIKKAKETNGLFWRVLTLGVLDYTPEAKKLDYKITNILAALGIPGALILHGYVGFIFGTVEAVAWWASALQPIIFIASAVVSGIAMLMLMYSFVMWRRGRACDLPMVRKLMTYLLLVFLVDYALEISEVAHAYLEDEHAWSLIGPLLFGPLFNSYFVVQMGFLSLVPMVLLFRIARGKLSEGKILVLSNVACVLLVLQVFFMRFNVVIGGQLISKSDRGFVDFQLHFLGREGILMAAVVLILPFIAYYLVTRFIMPVLQEN